ncbi:MAG TPA: hypothetical protein VJV78_19810 [Polyangiales bacterium]|nr:hypothetical protein [Polyangiales bacterium]
MKRWLCWSWVVLGCACGAETEGQSIAIHWTLGADDASAEREFVTDTGWQVSLDEARVGIASVFAIAPSADKPSAVARISGLFVSVAHAHGGHDDASGRRIRAELLDVIALDVLADEPQRTAAESAEAGDIETMKFELARAKDKLPAELHGKAAWVRGSAERNGTRVSFEGGVSLADDEPARRVETRVKLSLSEGGTLRVGVRPSEWFRSAEFDRLPEAADDEPSQITPDDQVGRAWTIGLRSPAAFDVSWDRAKD